MEDKPVAQQIDDIIEKHGGWKADILKNIRTAILESNTEIAEEIKWRMATRPEGLAVWTHNGIICFAEIWKDNIKLLFSYGAELSDPQKQFNARLMSKDIRAIEYREGDSVNTQALQDLVSKAIEFNKTKKTKSK